MKNDIFQVYFFQFTWKEICTCINYANCDDIYDLN